MKGDPEERAIAVGRYIAGTGATVRAAAVVFGNEGNGVSPALLSAGGQQIYIPMQGQAESLNVSTAAAVVLYEAVRQRQAVSQKR